MSSQLVYSELVAGLRRAEPLWLSLVLLALGDDVGEWMADLFR
jgi:hypothetical protein